MTRLGQKITFCDKNNAHLTLHTDVDHLSPASLLYNEQWNIFCSPPDDAMDRWELGVENIYFAVMSYLNHIIYQCM